MRAAFAIIRQRAIRKKIAFALTFDDFKAICAATGYLEGKGRSPKALSIDRKDALQGYTPDNIRVVTVSENARKGSYERRIFIAQGKFIEHREVNVCIGEHEQSELERRKSFVPFFTDRKYFPDSDQDDADDMPLWMKQQKPTTENIDEPF